MTVDALKTRSKPYHQGFFSALCIFLSFIMILLGEYIKEGVYDGLSFSIKVIVPTLFPFFILSDIWAACFSAKNDGILSRSFERLFNINGCGIRAMLCGLVCGFPLGVKAASELYIEKKITKDEFERLSGFVNNPSAAFIISGVGAGMLSDYRSGILLYCSVILSSVSVGIIFRGRKRECKNCNVNIRQNFNLVNSIKNAAMTSINVASYITFFSGILCIVEHFYKNPAGQALISSILEVGNATRLISSFPDFELPTKLALIGFSLGFSGMSVHMQAMSFYDRKSIPKKYLLMKTLQGLLSALVSFIFALFLA